MKKIVFVLFFAVVTLSVIGGISRIIAPDATDVAASGEPEVVSPGIFIIAEQGSMAKAGIRGQELSFDRSDFSRALNLKSVSDVTFVSVPPASDGKLFVGNTVVRSGQTVSGSNLSLLTFKAEDSRLTQTSFRFSSGGAAYDISCNLYFLDEVNYAPTVSIAPAVSLDVSTYENVTHYGTLSAYDPDGDECVFEIVSYPEKGLLVMNDSSTGEYVYVPNEGYVGKDSFKYVAKDKYGNFSAAAEVSVVVSRVALSSSFDDMKDSRAHASAIELSEAGIMSGTQIGDGYYFQPDKAVSRSEFVVLAMQTLGIKEVNSLRVTDFADDADIPTSMKGYVAAAYELEYINGCEVDGKLCFMPNESITRAEAAVIVGRMIEAATPVIAPTFADSEDIPAFAQSSVAALSALGVLQSEGGHIMANEAMSRGDVAMMLCAMMRVSE